MLPRISMPSLASITPPCFKVMKVTLLHSQAQFHHESDFASMTLVKGTRHSDSHPQFRSVEPFMLLELVLHAHPTLLKPNRKSVLLAGDRV